MKPKGNSVQDRDEEKAACLIHVKPEGRQNENSVSSAQVASQGGLCHPGAGYTGVSIL